MCLASWDGRAWLKAQNCFLRLDAGKQRVRLLILFPKGSEGSNPSPSVIFIRVNIMIEINIDIILTPDDLESLEKAEQDLREGKTKKLS